MMRVAFICSGNICRSPMAAGLAKHKLEERGIVGVIISAGTLNLTGRAAAREGVAAMKEIGLDISDHYSQGISVPLLKVADHIVVMAPKHEDALERVAPALSSKIVRMWEWASEPMDQIDDPVGMSIVEFRTCRDVLNTCLDAWLDSLEQDA